MASEISMNGRKKIETLQKEFTNKFHYLTLVFLDKQRQAIDVKKSLSEVRQAKGDDISIIASLKVNTLEKRFFQNFGLIVEVAYKKEDKVIYTKESVDKTLNELNKWCEENGCQPFEFKKRNTGITLHSVQEQLYHAVSVVYPNAIAKKINKDNFLDIHIPDINSKKGTHLFFNTAKDGIKIGFYCRDEEFVKKVLDKSDEIEKYAQGFRIKNNPNFENVLNATKGALEFLKNITGDDFDIDKVLIGLDSEEELIDQESSITERSENNIDLDAFIELLKNNNTSDNTVEVSLYTQQYSSLTYWLKYQLAGSLIEITRVNWSNDSYWDSSISISDLYEGLLHFSKNKDSYEFIENYVTSDLVDYVFSRVGTKDNGFEYQIDSIDPILETVPEEFQDYSGELDIPSVMNELSPISEDLSEQSIGRASYYEFKLNKYIYRLNIEEYSTEGENEKNNDDDISSDDLTDSNVELDVNEFLNALKEWDNQEESALVYYYTDSYSTFSQLLTFKIKKKEIVLKRNHWYEDSYWCDYTTVRELTKRIIDYSESDNDKYWLFPEGCTFYMAGEQNNGFDLEFVESSLDEKDYPKSILNDDGSLNLWKLYEEFDFKEEDDDQDQSSGKNIILTFNKYKCVIDTEESININVEENSDEVDEDEQNYTHQLGNIHGELITENYYEEISDFKENNLARVKRENKFGFIDLEGNEVVKCIYKVLFEFDGTYTLGIFEDEFSDEQIIHLINDKGHVTFTNKDFSECKSVIDNQVWIKVESTDKWTLFDCAGKMILETKHSVLAAASKDRHWVQDSNEQFGIIDSSDNLIVPFEIEQVEKLNNDFIVATKNDLNCLISPLGEKLTDYLYDDIGYSVLHNEGWFKIKQDGLYGILDKDGRKIISCSYEDLRCYLNDGFILVKNNEKWGAIDLNEQLMLPYEFDFLQEFCEDLAYFEKDDNGGFVDKAGKVIIDNLFIQPIELNFSGGYCVVYENEDECYLIDNKGRKASKNYSQLDYNKDLKMLVAQDSKGKYHYLDLDQKERIKTSADVCYSFINNYANVLKDELYGIIDITGKLIIPCEYEEYIEVKMNQAVVKKNGKYGVITIENEIIHDFIYDKVTTILLNDKLIYQLSILPQEQEPDYTLDITHSSRVLIIGDIDGFNSSKFVEDYFNVSTIDDEADVQTYMYIDSLKYITKNQDEFQYQSDNVFVNLDDINGLIEELETHNFDSVWLSENDDFLCLSSINEGSIIDLSEKLIELSKSATTISGVLFDIVFFEKNYS